MLLSVNLVEILNFYNIRKNAYWTCDGYIYCFDIYENFKEDYRK